MSHSKPYLSNPERIEAIIQQRSVYVGMSIMSDSPVILYDSGLKSLHDPPYGSDGGIYFREMDKKHPKIHRGKILVVTIIDEPLFKMTGVHFLIEDQNHDVANLAVHFLDESIADDLGLGYGSKLIISNPSSSLCPADEGLYIHIHDIRTVYIYGKKKDMCRYCGEENAERKCSSCKKMYCGKECQTKDWKVLKHKWVCKTR